MNKEQQRKYRDNLYDSYMEAAFEALANYKYYGKEYSNVEVQVKDMESKKSALNIELQNLQSSRKAENRERMKQLRKDIGLYDERLKSVAPMCKKMFEESVAWQQKGVRLLEQAENIRSFELKTPEEIEASKKVDPEKPVVAEK